MPEITVPDQKLFTGKLWSPPVPNVAVNRSEFSSTSSSWKGPGNGFWGLQCRVKPRIKESEKRPWRLFWDQAADRSNFFRVRRACNQVREVTPNPLLYVAENLSGGTEYQCRILGLTESVVNLRAGQFATIVFSSTRVELLMLATDLVAESGLSYGTATFTRPIRGTIPGAGLVAHLHNPFAFFRLDNFDAPLDESSGQLNIGIEASEYV